MNVVPILARALQLPSSASADQVAEALAERFTGEARQPSLSEPIGTMATASGRPPQERAGDAFHRLAELRAQAEGVSLADAYSRQSASTPELWDDVRAAQPRGY